MDRHILTRRNPDGTFDAVGMNNRTCLIEPISVARKQAQELANIHGVDVRFQTWREENFYADEKPNNQEIIKPLRTHGGARPCRTSATTASSARSASK